MKRLLLIGGGHTHVEALRQFAIDPVPDVAITLVSPHAGLTYSGMLPGLIAGHYAADEVRIDLAPLAARAGAEFTMASVERLDVSQRVAHCDDGTVAGFDVCSIDIGSTPRQDTPGAREHTTGIKPIERFLERWATESERASSGAYRNVAVVGGGAGGLEVLLAMQHAMQAAGGVADHVPRFHLVTDMPVILASYSAEVRRIFMRVLVQRGVAVHLDARVVEASPRSLHRAGGETIDTDFVVWATSAAAAPWIRASGLAVDENGFMLVDRHLESKSHPCIFGSGDIATLEPVPYPKSGVFAVRAAPVLAHNLRSALGDTRRKPFATTRTALALISTGDRYAVMAWGPFTLAGRWVWRWKDWIDRRFVRRYRGA